MSFFEIAGRSEGEEKDNTTASYIRIGASVADVWPIAPTWKDA